MPIDKITKKLVQLESTVETLTKYTKLSDSTNQLGSQSLYCYFNYSIIIDKNLAEENVIIGSFHVKNLSNQPMKTPIILLRLDTEYPCEFSGKYKTEQQIDEPFTFLWERIVMDHVDFYTHFSFKPVKSNVLEPNEQLDFENFQIKVPSGESITVEGFTYFNQDNDGVPSLNTIHINI